jgi:hypothetical protein
MPDPLLFDRQHRWLQGMLQLVQQRNDREVAIEENYHSTRSDAAAKLQTLRLALAKTKEREGTAADNKLNRDVQASEEEHKTQMQANDKELAETRLKVTQQSDEAEEKAKSGLHDACWKATTYYEAGEKEARDELQKGNNAARAGGERAEKIWHDLDTYLTECNLDLAQVLRNMPKQAATAPPTDPGQTMHNALKSADMFLNRLQNLIVPKLLTVGVSVVIFLILTGLACLPAIWQQPPMLWVIGGLFGGVILFVIVRAILKFVSVRQILATTERLARSVEVAEDAQRRLVEQTQATFDTTMGELKHTYERKTRQAENHFLPLIDQVLEKRTFLLTEAENRHRNNMENLQNRRNGDVKAAEDRNKSSKADSQAKHDRELAQAEAAHNEQMRTLEETYQKSWQELITLWETKLQDLRNEANTLRTENERLFPPWNSPAWQDRPVVTTVPRGVRVGEYAYDLARVSGGVPTDKRLKLDEPLRGQLPGFLPFPDRCALLIKSRDQTRTPAIQMLQALMMRFLTSCRRERCVSPSSIRWALATTLPLSCTSPITRKH